jgi:rhodanese-related sulfurtransferase
MSAPITVDQLLADARSGLRRLTPQQAHAQMARGLRLIDIRSDSQRASDGVIPGSLHVPRNVLEWRLDPLSPHRHPALAHRDARLAVICDEGYQSSLAAATVACLRAGRGDRRGWRIPRLAGGGPPGQALVCPSVLNASVSRQPHFATDRVVRTLPRYR